MRVAFLIPAPDYPEPFRWAFDAEARVLEGRGVQVDPVPWTQAADLDSYDLVLPLVAWGYHERYGEWLALLDRFEEKAVPVTNSPAILRWSSDKSYLAELGAKGVPTVPSIVAQSLDEAALQNARERFSCTTLVVKPPVSASAHQTYRLSTVDSIPADVRGRPMIVQPMIETIASEGEYSMMFFDGAFSHAVVKRPRAGDFRVQPNHGGTSVACEAPAEALAVAEAALAAAPAATSYARVDLVIDREGQFRVMELELVEPALFLDLAPESASDAFAVAVIGAARQFGRRNAA